MNQKQGKRTVLSRPEQVSVMASIGDTSYNPLHLDANEVRYVLNATGTPVDMLVVDGANNDVELRKVRYKGMQIAILSAEYWADNTIVPDVEDVALTKDLEQLILESSTITLPKGTTVIRDGDRIGIPVQRPQEIPVAKFIAAGVTWISSDDDQLMELVSKDYVVPLTEGKSITISFKFNTKTVQVVTKKRYMEPTPFAMIGQGDEDILLQFGINWIDPWIKAYEKLNSEDAVMMSYDSEKKAFRYYKDGELPPVIRTVKERSRFYDKPKVVEK